MTIYNFDKFVPRGTDCFLKNDCESRGISSEALPLWVADMDFATPQTVVAAVKEVVEAGILGYASVPKSYYAPVQDWYQTRFNWSIQPEWFVQTPGVVQAIHLAILTWTKPGEAVLIQEPVYQPFRVAPALTGRKLVVNQLVELDGQYSIDLAGFEQQIVEHDVKLFVLCSPHNPVGRVWTKAELTQMGDICLKHNVLVVSDEIHADFVMPYAASSTGSPDSISSVNRIAPAQKHTVYSSLGANYTEKSIILTAPSKTFNLAGLQLANTIIANAELRAQFKHTYTKVGLSQSPLLGLIACQVAYASGAEWADQLMAYIAGNMEYLSAELNNISGFAFQPPEATYLGWIDCRQFMRERNFNDKQLNDFFLNKAKLWLSDGVQFGNSGSGFMRINAATQRANLEVAVNRLKAAL